MTDEKQKPVRNLILLLRERPFIQLILICAAVISGTTAVNTYFYEMEKRHIVRTYQNEISELKLIIQGLQSGTDLPNTEGSISQQDSSGVEPKDDHIVCEFTNPMPGKDAQTEKTDFKVEGRAKNVNIVWLLVKPVESPGMASTIYRISTGENGLWNCHITLYPPEDDSVRMYHMFLYPGTEANSQYFSRMKKQSRTGTSAKEPDEHYGFIAIKRWKKRNGGV